MTEVRLVFGDGLDYGRVRIFENTPLPDWIATLGGSPKPNAITLGNTGYIPLTLNTGPTAIERGDLGHMAWLIHELAHQWQYQRAGWRYLFEALGAQARAGMKSYDYRGEHESEAASLREAVTRGLRLRDFNREQQGDLARHFYERLKQGQDVAPWEPFIAEIRTPRV